MKETDALVRCEDSKHHHGNGVRRVKVIPFKFQPQEHLPEIWFGIQVTDPGTGGYYEKGGRKIGPKVLHGYPVIELRSGMAAAYCTRKSAPAARMAMIRRFEGLGEDKVNEVFIKTLKAPSLPMIGLKQN